MDVRMDGRGAIITGGSRGLGRAMAMRFASSGANVAIVARREAVLAALETYRRTSPEMVIFGQVISNAMNSTS